jgi:hypothetical protein
VVVKLRHQQKYTSVASMSGVMWDRGEDVFTHYLKAPMPAFLMALEKGELTVEGKLVKFLKLPSL